MMRIKQTVLISLLIGTLFFVGASFIMPQPIQAEKSIPCEGYVCSDISTDPYVLSCVVQGYYAWSCTNWCYYINGKGYCQGISQCKYYY